MGVRNYLIEGVSGTGKTTVAAELELRGHHVIHGDRVLAYCGHPETGEQLVAPAGMSDADAVTWVNAHWIWSVDRVRALLADESHPATFFCGASRNSTHFIEEVDEVFVLEVDLETLSRRLMRRPEDEFGGRPFERELIVNLHMTRQDIPRAGVSIDATAPVARVVDEILAKCELAGL